MEREDEYRRRRRKQGQAALQVRSVRILRTVQQELRSIIYSSLATLNSFVILLNSLLSISYYRLQSIFKYLISSIVRVLTCSLVTSSGSIVGV